MRATARKKRTSSHCQVPGFLFINEQHMRTNERCKWASAALSSHAWTTGLVWGFRLAIAAQAVALVVQTIWAGLALSGCSTDALAARMLVGGIIFVISAAQVVLMFLLWRVAQVPGWLTAASVGLIVADGLQMASGRLQIFAIHLPLGAGLFGAPIALAIWAWMSRSTVAPRTASEREAAFIFRRRNLEKNL